MPRRTNPIIRQLDRKLDAQDKITGLDQDTAHRLREYSDRDLKVRNQWGGGFKVVKK